MSVLSVARRELQAASRRRMTFAVRLGSAVVATLIAGFMLAFLSATGAARQAGAGLFATLVFLTFTFAGLAGIFLAADAISEERRDGTLGLLFLTPLNGFDVVVGKLAAVGLNALFGLGAAFPVIAAAWFLGGVTAGEFWRTLLVLIDTLFLSLCLCLATSAGAREQSQALARSALLLVGLLVFVPLLSQGALRLGAPPWVAFPSDITPTALLSAQSDAAYSLRPGRFWRLLALQHGLAWTALAWAGWRLQRDWKDSGETRQHAPRIAPPGLRPPAPRRINPRWLDTDPVRALLTRGVWMPRAVWALGILTLAGGVGLSVLMVTLTRSAGPAGTPGATPVFIASGFLTYGFMFIRYAWKSMVAWESCAFFAEARRTGALDLLLTTAVTDAEVMAAHHRHLDRMFLIPGLMVLGGELTPGLALLLFAQGQPLGFQAFLNLGIGGVGMAIQYAAMTRLGAWLSLTGDRATVAFGKTLVFGAVLPSLFCCIGWAGAGAICAWAASRLSPGVRKLVAGDAARGARPRR